MSDSKSTGRGPRAVIERESERAHADEHAAEREAGDRASSKSFQDATIGFFTGAGRRAWGYADAHPHTVLYGCIGLVLAVLILWLGLWDTIVIAIFVGVGAAMGQLRDGDGGIYRFFNRLFGGRR